jgi:hypothetical protein
MMNGEILFEIKGGKVDAGGDIREIVKAKCETFAKELKEDWERRKLPIPDSITIGKIESGPKFCSFRTFMVFEGKGFGMKKFLPKNLPPNSIFMGSIIDREEGVEE